MFRKSLGQIGFKAAVAVDARSLLSMLVKALRGVFKGAFGGNVFRFEAADFLSSRLSFAQAVARIRQLLRHLRHGGRIGHLTVPAPALSQFGKLLLQRAEFREAVGFYLAPVL
jgi:hypothetical protein